MTEILQALQGLALLVIPAVGYLAYQFVRLQQVRITNQIKREEAATLAAELKEATATAVKSTSQTLTSVKRSEAGGLTPEVAEQARENTRQTIKKILPKEILDQLHAEYGKEAQLNEALDPLIEAAVHDLKKGGEPAAPPPKKETGT